MSSFGFVVREGVVTYTQDIDVVVYMEADGITHRGGQITLTLSDGDVYRVDCRAVDGAVFVRGAIACVAIICEAVCNGLKGFCAGELSTKPRLRPAAITLPMRADNAYDARITGTPRLHLI